ncbi:hypothetical protein OF83DRAFT_717535 [Amylostereum chailletii]|nr:hypothetical protein OF83DRAFT_717535 [Amylostereum chailletii]
MLPSPRGDSARECSRTGGMKRDRWARLRVRGRVASRVAPTEAMGGCVGRQKVLAHRTGGTSSLRPRSGTPTRGMRHTPGRRVSIAI